MPADTIQELLEICRLRGITSSTLRPIIEASCVRVPPEHFLYDAELKRATEISDTGLRAQLTCLLVVCNEGLVRRHLMTTGGVLDAIVRSTSFTPAELDDDTGLKSDPTDVIQ